jgi:hypothetical protein
MMSGFVGAAEVESARALGVGELVLNPQSVDELTRVIHARLAAVQHGLSAQAPGATFPITGAAALLSRRFKQHYGVTPSEYREAFAAGRATRQGGLPFRYHRLRRYLYERAPGKVVMWSEAPAPRRRGA